MISVDPGLRHCGVAIWQGSELIRAFLVANTIDRNTRGPLAWARMAACVVADVQSFGQGLGGAAVIEYPQVYSRGKGDPGDLIEIAGVAGAIVARFGALAGYLPREWKGQTPKKVTENRVKNALSPRELACICYPKPASLAHNIFDAIGIGLHFLNGSR